MLRMQLSQEDFSSSALLGRGLGRGLLQLILLRENDPTERQTQTRTTWHGIRQKVAKENFTNK